MDFFSSSSLGELLFSFLKDYGSSSSNEDPQGARLSYTGRKPDLAFNSPISVSFEVIWRFSVSMYRSWSWQCYE